MKINNRSNLINRKKVIITSVIAVIILGSGVFAYTRINSNNSQVPTPTIPKATNSVDYTAPTAGQVDAGNATKQTNANAAAQPSNTPAQSSLIIGVTAYQNTPTNIQVATTINTTSNDGTCILTISKGNVSKTYTVGVQLVSNYSTCKGFSIPVSDLGANPSGTWNITVGVTSSTANGNGTTTVSVN